MRRSRRQAASAATARDDRSRSATASGANPLNKTVWIAPMRLQAWVAAKASGRSGR